MSVRGLVLAAALALACGSGDVADLDLVGGRRCVECRGDRCAEPLEIEFLGAGGFALRRAGDLVLTDPFFTNPGRLRAIGVLPVSANAEAVDAGLPDDADRARAILVGHAHYDHLLDVPYVAEQHAREARVYGSDTTANILAAVPALRGRVESVEDRAWKQGEPEQRIDVPNSRVRFLALESQHAPHFYSLKFLGGGIDEPLDELPARSTGWLEGQTLAYWIEFLSPDRSRVDFRVHFQDSASNPPYGFPPVSEQPVDVAIPCVASHRFVERYPDALFERIRPRHVVMGHWEDFFRPWTRDPAELRSVPLTDPRDFIARLVALGIGESRRSLPAPRGRIVVGRCD